MMAALIWVLAVLVPAWGLARRAGRERLWPWALKTAGFGLLAARLGGVQAMPEGGWNLLALQDGRFSWAAGAFAVVVVGFLELRRTRALLRPICAVLAVATALALPAALMTPRPAVVVALTTLSGDPATIEGAGRAQVVNLWASWCGPCRREMPMLIEAAEAHPDIAFHFVNQGESGTTVAQFFLTHLIEGRGMLLDPGRTIARRFATIGLPATFFLAPDGRLLRAWVGELTREQLEAELAALRAAI